MNARGPAPAPTAGLFKLLGVVLGVFVLTFSLVPLYRIACEKVFGIRMERAPGSTRGNAAAIAGAGKRTVRVEFDAGVNSKLPWTFHPEQMTMDVVPGELNEALYFARNDSARAVVGSAVPSARNASIVASILLPCAHVDISCQLSGLATSVPRLTAG